MARSSAARRSRRCSASSATPQVERRRAGRAARRPRRTTPGSPPRLDVWMSHGDHVAALPPGFTVTARTDRMPARRMADEARALVRRAVPSRSHAHAAGRGAPASASCARSAAAQTLWTRGNIIEDADRARARAGRQRQGAARPVRRRRFLGGRRAAAQGDRRPADLRVRRSRPAAPATKATRSWRCSPSNMGVKVIRVDAERALPRRAARASATRKPSARSSAACSSRSSTRKRTKLADVEVAGAGHDLPGRDRVGRQQDRQGARHQVAPQRRRPAGEHEARSWSSRCASCSRTKCARSASSSACRARWSTAIRSRARASACASSAKCKQGVRRPAAPGRRTSSSTSCARHDLYDKTSQAFAVFLPVNSVGVMGDGRALRLRHRAARRGDHRLHDRALGAPAVRLPRHGLAAASSTKCAASRAWSTTSRGKPPATIEWE